MVTVNGDSIQLLLAAACPAAPSRDINVYRHHLSGAASSCALAFSRSMAALNFGSSL